MTFVMQDQELNDSEINSAETVEAQSERCFEKGDLKMALTLQQVALDKHVADGNLACEAACAQNVGYLCFVTKDHDGAVRAYSRAIALARELGDKERLATGLGRLAEVHQSSGRHLLALQVFEQSLEPLRQQGRLKEIGVVLNNMAVSYRDLSRREEAMACHQRALEIRREFNDADGLAASLHNLGVLYGDAGQYEQAQATLKESEEMRVSMGDLSGLARTVLRIGMLHEEQGDLVSAYACYERALGLARDPSVLMRDDEAVALNNMAGIHIASGAPMDALPLLMEAQNLFGELAAPANAAIHYNLGLAWSALNQTRQALEALTTAQTMQEQCDDRSGLSATFAALGVLCMREKQHDKANTWLTDALQVQTELGEEKARAMTMVLIAQLRNLEGRTEDASEQYRQAESVRRAILIESMASVPDSCAMAAFDTLQMHGVGSASLH